MSDTAHPQPLDDAEEARLKHFLIQKFSNPHAELESLLEVAERNQRKQG